MPEAVRTVGDREPTPLQVEHQLPPGLGALAHAVDEADEFLLTLLRGPNETTVRLLAILLNAGGA
jgi:hypothetical protein